MEKLILVVRVSEMDQKDEILVDWAKIDPHKVEWIVNNLYDKMGFRSILTSLSKDGGVDVIANYFSQEIQTYLKYVIQVKRWKKPVGVGIVRELLGVKEDQKADKAVMVSISGYARTSIDFASRHDIHLVDKDAFEEMLMKAQLLLVDGSLVSPSGPNLTLNRKKSIHKLLSESKPKGLLREEIIAGIASPRFRITVKKEVLDQDIDDLSKNGEIIEEEGKYYPTLSEDEISIISKNLSSDIASIRQVFTERDIYKLLEEKYKLPSPTAIRLIPLKDILEQLVQKGRINQIVEGVFISPSTLAKIKEFDWTRVTLRKNILDLIELQEDALEKCIEEVRTERGLPLGDQTQFFNRNLFEKMPFMIIALHFCEDRKAGCISGMLFLPLFMDPIRAMTERELQNARIKKETKKGRELKHVAKSENVDHAIHVSLGIGMETIKVFEEKAKQICLYGSRLIDLMKEFHMDKEFTLGCTGSEIGILALYNFKTKEKFGDCLNRLLDKAEILQKFLAKMYEKCPPPFAW